MTINDSIPVFLHYYVNSLSLNFLTSCNDPGTLVNNDVRTEYQFWDLSGIWALTELVRDHVELHDHVYTINLGKIL